MLRKMALSYEFVGSSTSDTDQHVSQHHHSLTNTQANNLLGTHDLNTRLRVGNSLKISVLREVKRKFGCLTSSSSADACTSDVRRKKTKIHLHYR
ncbi:hypothetical protein F2Q68_00000602 [Brassica cretica]|uniref:Uncharacterized protein n=1 Tax=Brassica cretica TaxID=69181 RepID=A0A8S9J9N8_BRACR|nr:hypothetical protein F2Q68_00000602 [Brassica cretica]